MAVPGSSLENNTGTSQAIPQKQKNTIYCGTDIPEISTKMLHARRKHALSYGTDPSGGGGKQREILSTHASTQRAGVLQPLTKTVNPLNVCATSTRLRGSAGNTKALYCSVTVKSPVLTTALRPAAFAWYIQRSACSTRSSPPSDVVPSSLAGV